MQSLMLFKLIAHKGAGDVSHQEMVWDSGRLHFKTKVDQLWGCVIAVASLSLIGVRNMRIWDLFGMSVTFKGKS